MLVIAAIIAGAITISFVVGVATGANLTDPAVGFVVFIPLALFFTVVMGVIHAVTVRLDGSTLIVRRVLVGVTRIEVARVERVDLPSVGINMRFVIAKGPSVRMYGAVGLGRLLQRLTDLRPDLVIEHPFWIL
jgi:hypothetical protein